MKKFSLKAVSAAALGFAVLGANAQVNIDLTTQIPALFAREIVATVGAPVVLTNAGTALNITTAVGYAFSPNEIRYVRAELANGVWTTAAATVANAIGVGAINGIGTSVIYFAVTAANDASLIASSVVTITGNRTITGTASNVTVSYSLYDQPSQAQGGGTTGRIISKADRQYINFVDSQRVVATADSAVSNVEVAPAFTTFAAGQTSGSTVRARLASLDFKLVATVPNLAAGTAISLADLNATGATGTKLVVTGDFSSAANSDGTYTVAALNRVYLSDVNTCANVTMPVPTGGLTATTASFNVGATPTTANPHLCLAPRSAGTSTGVLIPAATYTSSLNPVSAAPAVYAVSAISSGTVSTITRNGTELQAPLVQVPGGFIARFVLTNTGAVDAAYTGTVTAGPLSLVTANGTLTGIIPAGGQVIIEGSAMPSFATSGPSRGFAVFTVARPTSQIQGMYQIVNLATGAVSNTAMQRPGTN